MNNLPTIGEICPSFHVDSHLISVVCINFCLAFADLLYSKERKHPLLLHILRKGVLPFHNSACFNKCRTVK